LACNDAVALAEFLSIYQDLPALANLTDVPRDAETLMAEVAKPRSRMFVRMVRVLLDAALADMEGALGYPERWTRIVDDYSWPEVLRRWTCEGPDGGAMRQKYLNAVTKEAVETMGMHACGVDVLKVRQKCALLVCLANDVGDTSSAASHMEAAAAKVEDERKKHEAERSALVLDTKARQDAETMQMMKARSAELAETSKRCEARTVPLGSDRDGRLYYCLACDATRIHVEEPPTERSASTTIRVYKSTAKLELLVDWLDERSTLERSLRREIQAIVRKRVQAVEEDEEEEEEDEEDSDEDDEDESDEGDGGGEGEDEDEGAGTDDTEKMGSDESSDDGDHLLSTSYTSLLFRSCVGRAANRTVELINAFRNHVKKQEGTREVPVSLCRETDALIRQVKAAKTNSKAVAKIAGVLKLVEVRTTEYMARPNTEGEASDNSDDDDEEADEEHDDRQRLAEECGDEASMDRAVADLWHDEPEDSSRMWVSKRERRIYQAELRELTDGKSVSAPRLVYSVESLFDRLVRAKSGKRIRSAKIANSAALHGPDTGAGGGVRSKP